MVCLQGALTVPSQAMRLDQLLKAFSESSHQTMHASKPMANRVVIVAGPPETPEALRADLATATWGKWRRVGDEWFLDEDVEAVRKRERSRLSARIEAIRKAQAAEGAKAAVPFTKDSAKALVAKLQSLDKAREKDDQNFNSAWQPLKDSMPSMVALRRVFASMDPELLAQQTEGTVVYSDRPTRLQKPLSQSAKNAIRQLERDQSVWAGVSTDDQSWHGKGPVYTMDPRNYADPVGQGSLRLVVRCESQGSGSGVFMTAWFVDKDLKLRQFAEMNVGFGEGSLQGEKPPAEIPNEAPLTLSPDALNFAKGLAGEGLRAFRPKLLTPEKNEPMELLCGDLLRASAASRQKPIVAWLPDRVAYLGTMVSRSKNESDKPTASRVLTMCYRFGLSVLDEDGRIVVRPRDSSGNVDRTALGALTRTVDQRGFAPLDELADYAGVVGGEWMDPLATLWVNGVQPGANDLASTDWKTLQIWSVFSRPQRAALLKGGSLPWRQLTAPQRDVITNAIVNARQYEIRRIGPGGSGLGLTEEPTEILANGFSLNTDVVGSGSIQDAVFVGGDGTGYGRIAGAWQLAYSTYSREKGNGDDARDGFPKVLPEAFTPGKQVAYGLSMQIGPNLSWSKSSSVGEVDLRQSPKPLDSLPSSFLTRFRQNLDQIRKQEDRNGNG